MSDKQITISKNIQEYISNLKTVQNECVSNLIDCSISFFEQTGHKFESSDKTATNSIKGN